MSIIPITSLYGVDVTLAGWGLSNNNSVAINLQVASTTTITKKDCENRLEAIMAVTISLDDIYICSISDPYILLNYVRIGYLQFILFVLESVFYSNY
jgi:hypothetical protein